MPYPQTLDFNSDAFRRDAYQYYATLRREAPVFFSQPEGQLPIWYATGARDPSRISAEFAALFHVVDERTSALINNHMLNRDGEDHRRLRRLVSKAFTLKAINAMRPRIQQIADELLDNIGPAGEMDLVSQYAFPLPIIAIAELLGVPPEDRDDFRRWSHVLVRQIGHDLREVERCYIEFTEYMVALIEARRAQPTDDLISALVQVEEESATLSQSELCSMIVLLIVAGHETSVSQIGNAALALMQHPQALARLRDDPSLMPNAVEELLRYDASVERALIRFVTEDTELAGHNLRRGQLVVAVVGAANRDESVCARPETLDIARPACPHMAFGKGIHYCMGASLARMEVDIALSTLLRRCPGLQLAVDADTLQWRNVPNFRGLETLPVRWSVS
jgi:cytochrome P450